jgi:hypothetical protein
MNNIKHSIFLQRQIEAQLLKPVIEGLSSVYDEDEVIKNIRGSIEKIAFENGRKFKEEQKDNSLLTYAGNWKKLAEGDSLTIEDFKLSDSKLTFRITRCQYAEFYKQLKSTKLGETLSCCRDQAFLNGFSDNIEMVRSKSILDGNPSCDFEFTYKNQK